MKKQSLREEMLREELQRVDNELKQPVLIQKACEVLIEDLRSLKGLTRWKERNVKAQIKNLREIVKHCQTLKSAQKGQ